MIYLDANFFIFALLDNTRKGKNARKILGEIIHGKKAITSSLALDEIMWVLQRNKKKHLIQKIIEDIYAIPHLSIIGVSSEIPLHALQYLHKFSPRDAFHLAIMREQSIEKIVTDDKYFDKIGGITRIKIA